MSEKWELNKYLIKEEVMMVWEETWGMGDKETCQKERESIG